jgi:UDP-glucose 4-epimerase
MQNGFQSACVTGGAGFIGSRLVRRLLERGLRVTVLDNLSTGRRASIPAGVRFVEGDILIPGDCERALENCDLLFHLAARVAIRSSFDYVVEDTMCNVVGTASVLRAAIRVGSIKRVVSASSMGIYSDSPTPIPIAESYPAVPVSPYGISKLALEQLTHQMANSAGFESVVLRLFNTYGPGQRYSPYVGVITIFINKLSSGEQPTIFGDGQQARDFVHVDDVVSGFLAAIDFSCSGETINIGSGVAHTVQQIYQAVAAVLGSNIPPLFSPPVPGELRYSIASIEKARRVLHYEPRCVFETALPSLVSQILADRPTH